MVGLSGFADAIRAVFPQAEIQRYIVHRIRNSTRYIYYKDLKESIADLKHVYQELAEELALVSLDKLDDKWGKKYPAAIKSWGSNWTELSTYFKYPPEIRKIIYTTNAIENFNRGLRKTTKSKAAWSSEDALLKALYLTIRDLPRNGQIKIQGWDQILDQLMIYFEGRITE